MGAGNGPGELVPAGTASWPITVSDTRIGAPLPGRQAGDGGAQRLGPVKIVGRRQAVGRRS